MPGQPGSERRRLQAVVTLRMHGDLAKLCTSSAHAAELTLAEWLRRVAAAAVHFGDYEQRRSKPRARPKRRPDDLVRSLAGVADQLANLTEILAGSPHTQAPTEKLLALDHQRVALALARAASADVVLLVEKVVQR